MSQACVFCSKEIGSPSSYEIGSFEFKARKIGMCDDCYSRLTNYPKPSEVEKIGPRLKSCLTCRAPLFKKDVDEGCCPICAVSIN